VLMCGEKEREGKRVGRGDTYAWSVRSLERDVPRNTYIHNVDIRGHSTHGQCQQALDMGGPGILG
jgi:hypothetical protein